MNPPLAYVNRLSRKVQVARLLWAVAYYLLFRPTPRWGLNRWRSLILRAFGARIGRGCRIDPSCKIWAPWNLFMGDFCAIAANVDCYNVAQIIFGTKVAVSQRSFLCTASHDIRSVHRPLTTSPIRIENHVWVAAEAMVFPGVTLHEGCVVGARAVVLRDVPSWSVAAGFPASVKGRRVVLDGHLLQVKKD